MTGLCISGLADAHGDFGAEHRLVTDVGHHRHLDVAGLIPIHRAASGNRADVSVGLGQVFHRHPFGNPAATVRNGGVGHAAGGKFGSIAQGDGMHPTDMIQHFTMFGEAGLGIAGAQLDHRRGDALREANRQYFAQILTALAEYRRQGLFKALPDDCFASVVIGPTHDLARNWLAGRTQNELGECRELLAQIAWDSVKKSG